jgi:hypothetical protein
MFPARGHFTWLDREIPTPDLKVMHPVCLGCSYLLVIALFSLVASSMAWRLLISGCDYVCSGAGKNRQGKAASV